MFIKILIGIQIACVFFFLFSLYILFRNGRVYRFRNYLLYSRETAKDSLAEYAKYPSYHEMMSKFWVWPLRKFRKKEVEK